MAQLMETIAVLLVNLTISFAAGCATRYQDFQAAFRRWPAVLTCIGVQFGVRPTCAYLLCLALDVPKNAAIGIMLCCFAPGGNGSNLLELIFGGDIELGIVCTTVSSITAAGAIPLCYYLFIKPLDVADADGQFKMPWGEIGSSVGTVVVGACMGAFTRFKNEELGKMLEQRVAAAGVMLLVIAVCVIVLANMDAFVDIHWRAYVVGMMPGPITIAATYLPTKMAGMRKKSCRTVVIEAAECNIGLAFAMMLLIWPVDEEIPETETKQKQVFQGIIAYTMFNAVYPWGLTLMWYCEQSQLRNERRGNPMERSNVDDIMDEVMQEYAEGRNVKVVMKRSLPKANEPKNHSLATLEEGSGNPDTDTARKSNVDNVNDAAQQRSERDLTNRTETDVSMVGDGEGISAPMALVSSLVEASPDLNGFNVFPRQGSSDSIDATLKKGDSGEAVLAGGSILERRQSHGATSALL